MSNRRRTYYIGGGGDMAKYGLVLDANSSGGDAVVTNIVLMKTGVNYEINLNVSTSLMYYDEMTDSLILNPNSVRTSPYCYGWGKLPTIGDKVSGSEVRDNYGNYIYSASWNSNSKCRKLNDNGLSDISSGGPIWYDNITDAFYLSVLICDYVEDEDDNPSYHKVSKFRIYKCDSNGILLEQMYSNSASSSSSIQISYVYNGKCYLAKNSGNGNTTTILDLLTKETESITNNLVNRKYFYGILV